MANVIINDTNLTNIANAIRGKNGESATYKPSEMAAAITAIPSGGGGGLPEEALTITGDCSYQFAYNNWNWFIEDYGNQITTKSIIAGDNMFYYSTELTNIPFDINLVTTSSNGTSLYNIFYRCQSITSIPNFYGKLGRTNQMFRSCNLLREIPVEAFENVDWSARQTATSPSSYSTNGMFYDCYSLRNFPMDLLRYSSPKLSYSSTYFYNGFYSCLVLDELIDLPIPYTATYTSNIFYQSFYLCYRLKNITFETDEGGSPKVVSWKSQTIDLTSAGCPTNTTTKQSFINYNSGITEDKMVSDDATYQALKNDPDWFSCTKPYARYNHDSAVATINSLPDTSAYLATAGGTNTIKFTGAAGSATDGGAINTLTSEEIAVATAKGWTVTLV